MPYDMIIIDVEKKKTRHEILEELKDMREILQEYENKTIEVQIIKIKEIKK